MARLPRMRYADKIRTSTFDVFKGYVHREAAGDGVIFDEKNMWGGAYPAASSRPERMKLKLSSDSYTGELPYFFDFTAWDGVFYLLTYDSEADRCFLYAYDPSSDQSPRLLGGWPMTGSVDPRHWVKMGDRLVIFPDAVVYDRRGDTLETIAVSCGLGNCEFSDGTYAGVSAKANTIKTAAADVTYIRSGDTVRISGCITHTENNTVLTVREKDIDGEVCYLRFYENSFVLGTGTSYVEKGDVTLSRELPSDDVIRFACECDGRIWAAGRNYIFASAQNDPFNWNTFDSLPGDSYAIRCPGGGEITGACTYLGYPIFFKEDGIYKILGDTAEEFTVSSLQCPGLRAGCEFSLAIAGGALFYNSKSGIVRYTGGTPSAMYFDFGRDKYRYAVGGSDGIRYYVKLTDSEAGVGDQVFMYDTELSMWFRYDDPSYQTFSYDGNLWAMDNYSGIYVLGEASDLPERMEKEGEFDSYVIFTDFTGSYHGRKGVSRVHLRVELDSGTEFHAAIRYDAASDDVGGWEEAYSYSAEGSKKLTLSVPLIVRRCDHFTLKLSAHGQWKLYQLTLERYNGSAQH